jgi:hypothetical protein
MHRTFPRPARPAHHRTGPFGQLHAALWRAIRAAADRRDGDAATVLLIYADRLNAVFRAQRTGEAIAPERLEALVCDFLDFAELCHATTPGGWIGPDLAAVFPPEWVARVYNLSGRSAGYYQLAEIVLRYVAA